MPPWSPVRRPTVALVAALLVGSLLAPAAAASVAAPEASPDGRPGPSFDRAVVTVERGAETAVPLSFGDHRRLNVTFRSDGGRLVTVGLRDADGDGRAVLRLDTVVPSDEPGFLAADGATVTRRSVAYPSDPTPAVGGNYTLVAARNGTRFDTAAVRVEAPGGGPVAAAFLRQRGRVLLSGETHVTFNVSLSGTRRVRFTAQADGNGYPDYGATLVDADGDGWVNVTVADGAPVRVAGPDRATDHTRTEGYVGSLVGSFDVALSVTGERLATATRVRNDATPTPTPAVDRGGTTTPAPGAGTARGDGTGTARGRARTTAPSAGSGPGFGPGVALAALLAGAVAAGLRRR